MTAYVFETGRLEGDNGSNATLHVVSLDLNLVLQTVYEAEKVRVALMDGELKITGTAERIDMIEGERPATGQVYFQTATSNFGVAKIVTIKLNNCLFQGNSFEAKADECGNVFTLSTEE